ncbi:hypothetical protein V9T40_002448 [Parthenolecanium corni]|uniref:C2H2-type domain-containing protein n=1 Tax=Parthenolecanium corni TaxID=536013 RepID=A0AAN9Y5D8_9HEMI
MNVTNPVVCFVCNQKVTGEKVNLASSIATHSKVTLPEKISQLIGDDYVVAVTEQDCVCKRCASLLNHMDKLENELSLVKRALTSNISSKYKININDGYFASQAIANGGLKTDSASDYEDEARKVNPELSATSTPQVKKKAIQANRVVTTPKLAKPPENVTKLKIYKCGFCSYQSKELSNVRLHMKIHIRSNKPDAGGDAGDKTNAVVGGGIGGTVSSSPLLTPKNPMSVRRRVFRCQVCSASFDDRNKCLEHISRDHTAAGRKLVEQKQPQEEQPQLNNNKTSSDHDIPDSTDVQLNVPSNDSVAAAVTRAEPSDIENGVELKQEQQQQQQQQQQKDSLDELGSQEEMDTADPPSIALYSCDTCSNTFDNDVDFANHVNEHDKNEGVNVEQKLSSMEVDESLSSTKETAANFGPEATSTELTRATNDDETPKDSNMGLDIEAMIAALHSEGPENASDSMPSI